MFGLLRRRCPVCHTALDHNSCPQCSRPEPDERPRYVSQRSATTQPGAVDIGVLVDRTGSGAPFSRGVSLATTTILREVADLLPGTRAWVQTHGDEDYGEHPELVVEPGPVDHGIAAVSSIQFSGGGDNPETHLSAIEAALGHLDRFTANASIRRALLVFLTDDTKPAKSGMSASQIGGLLRDSGVLFYLICEPTPRLRDLSAAAEGLLFEITNNPSEEMMQEIASQIAGSVYFSVSSRSKRAVHAPGGLLTPPTEGLGGQTRSRLLPGS